MRGILIKKEFVLEIIKHEKAIEFRNYKLPANYVDTAIYLLSGGRVYAAIELEYNRIFHGLYQYIIHVGTVYDPPLWYYHPKGAVLYVKRVKFKK